MKIHKFDVNTNETFVAYSFVTRAVFGINQGGEIPNTIRLNHYPTERQIAAASFANAFAQMPDIEANSRDNTLEDEIALEDDVALDDEIALDDEDAFFNGFVVSSMINLIAITALPAVCGIKLADFLASKHPEFLRQSLATFEWLSLFTSLVIASKDVQATELSLQQKEEPTHARAKVKDFSYPEVVKLVSIKGACSGTIIAKNAVLTAAHCVGSLKKKDVPSLVIRAQSAENENVASRFTYRAAEIKFHQDFRANAFNSGKDFAVVFINEAFPVSSIHPLPSLADCNQRIKHGLHFDCIALGFGIMNDEDIETQKRKIRLLARRENQDSIRAIYPKDRRLGPCQGDSGGPLFTADGNIQVGVMSFYKHRGADVCGKTIRISTYGNLCEQLSWVQHQLIKNQLNLA